MIRTTHAVVIAFSSVMLITVSNPRTANATVLTGTVSSPVNVTDQITMNSVTNTAAGTITTNTGSNPAIIVNGTTSIGGDIVSNGNFPILFNTGHDVVQTAGMVEVTPFRSLQFTGGNYVLNGGAMQPGTWFNIGATGSNFVQNGGTISGNGETGNFDGTTGQGGVDVGGRSQVVPGGNFTATMTLNGGSITTATFGVGRYTTDLINPVREHGIVIQEAGSTVSIVSNQTPQGNAQDTGAAFVISHLNHGSLGANAAESSYTLKGGSLSIPNAHTKNYQWGKFAGYGTVTTNSARTLYNSGKVVADGFGIDRTLNLSQYGSILNETENGTERTGAGWYAQNHGKLTLPTLAVAAGDSTVNWGESSADTTIDLVNSVRMGFDDVQTAGGVSISLLSPDRADVPAAPIWSFFGVWDIAPVSPFALGGGSVDLTFRYDDAAAGINNVHLYHHVGGVWTELAVSPSGGSFTIAANDVATLGLFAVAVPEPSSSALLGLGSMGLVFIRRRRRAN